MTRNRLRNLEYLKQDYKPEEIQKLLESSSTKREVYQELKVSEYVLDNYIKQYKLAGKNRQKLQDKDKSDELNEAPQKVSVDNSVFKEIADPVERFRARLLKKREERTLKELKDPYA